MVLSAPSDSSIVGIDDRFNLPQVNFGDFSIENAQDFFLTDPTTIDDQFDYLFSDQQTSPSYLFANLKDVEGIQLDLGSALFKPAADVFRPVSPFDFNFDDSSSTTSKAIEETIIISSNATTPEVIEIESIITVSSTSTETTTPVPVTTDPNFVSDETFDEIMKELEYPTMEKVVTTTASTSTSTADVFALATTDEIPLSNFLPITPPCEHSKAKVTIKKETSSRKRKASDDFTTSESPKLKSVKRESSSGPTINATTEIIELDSNAIPVYSVADVEPSLEFELIRSLKFVSEMKETPKITRCFYNRPNFLNEVHDHDHSYVYTPNTRFNNNCYEPQYFQTNTDESGKPILSTKKGLCGYCKDIHFYVLKNSNYNSHLANIHGINSQGLLYPDPLYGGIYNFAKGETGNNCNTAKHYKFTEREKPAVVCPGCYNFFDFNDNFTTYLRHFRYVHTHK
ncbi:hypothetical protein DFJ63DRAFT_315547 [Scheffersomyces coipomensis]|uniref:uncharacterized protein n=1 Tax=Scheffersomyces coipomensis TaxID=1788519 RepID=UPI00315C5718